MLSAIKAEDSRNDSSNEKALKKLTRGMLRNHDFVGSYLEKRFVNSLNCYKKIIKIANTENIFIKNLSLIKRRLEQFYEGSKWIGISCTETPGAPVKYFNIWVDIEEEIFGVYKFLVKDVSFSENQVVLKIEMIKPCRIRESSSDSFEHSSSLMDECEKPVLSWNGMDFIFLLILTIITGGGHIIKYVLDYILKLLEVSTPIIVAFLNTVAKMFGYLCFLIAFLWKGDSSKNSTYRQQTRSIYYQPAYPYESRYKALQYKPKSSDVRLVVLLLLFLLITKELIFLVLLLLFLLLITKELIFLVLLLLLITELEE